MKGVHTKAFKVILATLTLLLQACTSSITSKQVASLALEVGSCDSFETYFHDKLQTSFQNNKELPGVDDIVADFEEALIEKLSADSIEEPKLEALKESLKNLYSIIIKETENDPTLGDLIKLEYHTHENNELQTQYNKSLKSYVSNLKSNYNNCNTSVLDEIGSVDQKEEDETFLPFYEELRAKTNLAQFGAIKSFSVAYQSCSAHTQKALDHIDESLDGVDRIGTHPAGGGIRVISDIDKVLKTHPYIANNRVPSSVECDDPEVSPKIYDFGGKPFATSDENSSLNYFTDGGTGSLELGVDCSGYIYSALMTSGLKLAPNRPLRARGVTATPARHWKNLDEDMSCFSKIKAGESKVIQPGDIFASTGHIFIINKVGEDPLGVDAIIESGSSCDLVSYEDFDFTIFQSSPTNGAIGMNHMQASYYLSDSNTMMIGFEKFAKLHCNNLKANSSQTPQIDEASLIRHNMTPECIDEKVIKLDYESCLERCSGEDA